MKILQGAGEAIEMPGALAETHVAPHGWRNWDTVRSAKYEELGAFHIKATRLLGISVSFSALLGDYLFDETLIMGLNIVVAAHASMNHCRALLQLYVQASTFGHENADMATKRGRQKASKHLTE